jgi:hypothetical protein
VIERLADMPPGTIGFRAAGGIERDDEDEVLVRELRQATNVFAWMIHGEARVFPRAELEQAKAWVAG